MAGRRQSAEGFDFSWSVTTLSKQTDELKAVSKLNHKSRSQIPNLVIVHKVYMQLMYFDIFLGVVRDSFSMTIWWSRRK